MPANGRQRALRTIPHHSVAREASKSTHTRSRRARKEGLDVASGAVEGAVRHVIGKRFDSSGMRWIRKRAEALLQLRCIEINGDWDDLISFVEARVHSSSQENQEAARVLTNTPAALPTYGVGAWCDPRKNICARIKATRGESWK